jgi:GntR family transcriptional regulator, transcriptional repressor for pyruvate dehydrogenase complex
VASSARLAPVLTHLTPIRVSRPADVIATRIQELVQAGLLRPGDRLPPERTLAERFAVGRGHVREALKRLEFYGVLQTRPQSGTVVTDRGARALEGRTASALALDEGDFASLQETRSVLEVHAAARAARQATAADVVRIGRALEELRAAVAGGEAGLDQDLRFHLAVAAAAHSPVLHSLIRLLTPGVITSSLTDDACGGGRHRRALEEHVAVFEAMRRRDAAAAGAAMRIHMRNSKKQPRGG